MMGKAKKWFTVLLVSVLLTGLLALPASAAGWQEVSFDQANALAGAAKAKTGDSFILVFDSRYCGNCAYYLPAVKTYTDGLGLTVYELDAYNTLGGTDTSFAWWDFIEPVGGYGEYPMVIIYNAAAKTVTVDDGVLGVDSFRGLLEKSGYLKAAPADEPSAWATAELLSARELGLLPEGLDSGYQTKITRKDFCLLAVNLVEVYEGKTAEAVLAERGLTVRAGVFADTDDGDILAANALGIVSGKGNGLFDPDGSITRQEAAVMLMNTAKALGLTERNALPQNFSDSTDAASWARGAIAFVSGTEDSVSGYRVMGGSGGKFNPLGTYTRQESFATMLRLYDALSCAGGSCRVDF